MKEGWEAMDKKLVYFLCTGNSCRSQMAKGFLKALGGDKFEAKSAGLEAHGLNPRAVQVMKEAGVDISHHTSDVIDPEILSKADLLCAVTSTTTAQWYVMTKRKDGIGALMIRQRRREPKKKLWRSFEKFVTP
jgi:thioredoxin type arsenate reductase